MAAPILLSSYKMKKIQKKQALNESQIPVDLKTVREFRSEMLSRFFDVDAQFKQVGARFEQIDARFEQIDKRFEQIDKRFEQIDKRFEQIDARFEQIDKRFEQIDAQFKEVDARFDQMEARFESLESKLMAEIHSVKLLMEEQNLRNKQVYDALMFLFEKYASLEDRIKPECLKDKDS